MKKTPFFIILIAYFAFVSLGLFDGILGVAWPGLRDTFGLFNRDQGVLVALGVAGYITAGLANGRLITRYGIAALLIGSAILTLLARLGQGVSPTWTLALVLAPLAGAGAGLLDAGMNTYAAARFRPRLINWLHASFGVGTTLGALAMTSILSLGGTWRIGFGVMAVMQLVVLVLVATTFGRWRLAEPEETVNPEKTNAFATSAETLRQPIVWLGIAFFFIYTAVEIGFAFWGFTILTESRGMSAELAGLLATLYWGSFTGGRIVLGFIETRLERLVRWSLVGTIIGTALFAINAFDGLTVVAILLLGFAQAPIFPAMIAYTPQRVGRPHAPNAIGFQIAAAGLGVAVFPGIAGVLADTVGLEAIGWLLLAAAVVLMGLHEGIRINN